MDTYFESEILSEIFNPKFLSLFLFSQMIYRMVNVRSSISMNYLLYPVLLQEFQYITLQEKRIIFRMIFSSHNDFSLKNLYKNTTSDANFNSEEFQK